MPADSPSTPSRALPDGLTPDAIIDAAQQGDGAGFCLDCGAENGGVEPDAEGYPCEICGAHRVAGAEQILLGLL
jgi:hypothetical protein